MQNVRTAIKHLILTGEITSKQQAKFTVITVKNYDKYQLDNRVTNNLLTENQQASNKLLTTIEEGKKVRREESNNNIPSAPDDKSPCAGSFLLNDGTSYEITENDKENIKQH